MTTWLIEGVDDRGKKNWIVEPDHISDEPLLNPSPGTLVRFHDWNMMPVKNSTDYFCENFRVFRDGRLYAMRAGRVDDHCKWGSIPKKPDWYSLALDILDKDLVK